jgi:predicted acylesterase/phospholipase RssA
MSNALLLAGGGSHGAWSSGAAKALKDSGIKFDAIYGSSVGTLNGLLIFQDKWDELEDLWMTCKTSMIYNRHWFKGLGQVSLYDTNPLRKLIESKVDLNKIRANRDQKFIISTTDFSTGDSLAFEINDLPDEDIVDILLASASPPVFFPPVEYKGKQLVDAGVTDNFGLTRAINDGHDTLYVIKFPQTKMKRVRNKLDALTNTISAAMDSDYNKEKAAVYKINQLADYCDQWDSNIKPIKIIEIVTDNPDELSYDFLDFDFKNINRRELFESGYRAALKAING